MLTLAQIAYLFIIKIYLLDDERFKNKNFYRYGHSECKSNGQTDGSIIILYYKLLMAG